jgi:hypothetical protein
MCRYVKEYDASKSLTGNRNPVSAPESQNLRTRLSAGLREPRLNKVRQKKALHGTADATRRFCPANPVTGKSNTAPVKRLARASQIWQIRVLTAKLRRLLKAVPVVMLVMQVIDETNNAGALFRSDEPIVSADLWQFRGRAKWAADERG